MVHPSIGVLKQLKLLDLSGCKSLKNLPKNLGCVESLEELKISQTLIKELPSSICSLKKLKVLKGGGTLSNPVTLQLFKSFSSLSSLETLSLKYCNLSDKMIPYNLDSLSLLKKLFLYGNKFKSVPEFVWKLSKLEELDLSHYNLLDGGIPNDIGYLPSLRILYLEGNKFEGIPEFVWKLSKLEELDLSNCNLLDGGIPNDIGYLSSLRILFLYGNKFKSVPKFVWKLSKLEELDLSHCNLFDGGIPNDIGYLPSLRILYLYGNKFKSVPEFVWKLSKLEQLDLSHCNLLDGGIPNDIGYLPSLWILYLDGNKFEGIPEFVWKLSKLEILNLSHCNLLDGGIPNDISCASSLRSLYLKGNKFMTISNNIFQLLNLSWLDLRDNSELEALPKLPCALGVLWRSGCPLLDTSSMNKWGSGVKTWKNTFGVSYHGYDGKSYKVLYTDSEYTSTSELHLKWVYVDVACGPTLEYEIHEWFETRSNGSYEIQGRIQESEIWNLEGIALFIVYEVHENSNSKGSNDSNPAIVEIACQMRCERTGSESLESRVVEVSPSERTGFERRRNGVWVFLSVAAIKKCLPKCNYPERFDITLSVSAESPNIEVKEYGVRIVTEANKGGWCKVLSEISFHGWAPKSFKDFCFHSFRPCCYF